MEAMANQTAKPLPQLPNQQQPPKMVVQTADGKEIGVDLVRVMENLKHHNAKLSEENAILKAILQEKGVYL